VVSPWGEAGIAPISVVVPTCNRGASVVETVKTILANDYAQFECLLVDQSDNTQTYDAIRCFLEDSRFKYWHLESRGASKARNFGILNAQSEYIALTDDDCRVPTSWLRDLMAAFAIHPQIGLVSGNVIAAPYDPTTGWIPALTLDQAVLLRSPAERPWPQGFGACMGLRRTCCQAVGGFDELLGPGTIFPSSEDVELGIRMLQRGYFIYEAPSVSVVHDGFRNHRQVRSLLYNYWLGNAAVLAKLVRAGRWAIVPPVWRKLALSSVLIDATPLALLKGRRPRRFLHLKAFLVGFGLGLCRPVDRKTLKWQP
jgi:GT2 family glycosyltransferase